MGAEGASVDAVLNGLFRRQAGQLVATLTRVFGPARLDLAESVVQEALLLALQTWPHAGIPDNPAGWIMRVARNKALDHLRHERVQVGKEAALGRFFDDAAADGASSRPLDEALALAGELREDRLRLLFVCCHPALARDAQSALALKTLFGLSTREIAGAFLTQEATVAQRLVRAKRRVAEAGLRFEIPPPEELPERLDAALEALYLLFSEGYATRGEGELIRKDVCLEAIRLLDALASHPAGDVPHAHALLALMCFQASRLDARTDERGDILLLEEQDRALWDEALIARGARHLDRAAAGDRLTAYHLEAGIAAVHALAPSHAATDWRRIVGCYDDLLVLAPSPVIALNRAAAVAMADGPEAGLTALAALEGSKAMQGYFLFHGVRAELLRKLGRAAEARTAFAQALGTPHSAAERRFVERRLVELG